MEEIRIVEYDHSLAEKIADMWGKSADGWNGMNMVKTTDAIIREHNNSFHLNVYLALNSCDEVVGYCSLDRYTRDENALYINLLNVRPDYHGRKVGKMLVLECVRRTVDLGWPRVDLNTWPGNTKAVPLYKKCGFFWEKRDDTTHLMNYIPTVLKTEALNDFFKDAHWYEDSQRIIEVKPDGRNENGFDYFEYSWEHSGKRLRVEFERTGRGIRLIETDDYLISAEVEQHELVFGMDYAVT
ncbi:MAG: GNAT family N-acetyltransferase [Ruminiclostridium sp.]|nr:GNAT family N-acetyltransferase [Ruminiclostridium sp.]